MRRTSKRSAVCALLAATALAWSSPPPAVVLAPVEAQASPIHRYGRAFLLKGQNEAPGYGAYSYVILGPSPKSFAPSASAAVLSAYLAIREIGHGDATGTERRDANIVYLPLVETPPPTADSEWLLAHYDYARARSILEAAAAAAPNEPNLVSFFGSPPGQSPSNQKEFLVVPLDANSGGLASALDQQVSLPKEAPPPMTPANPVRGMGRLTGRDFLLAGQQEGKDYGLYSYVLFGEPINAGNHDLYRAVLDAFLHLTKASNFEAEKVPRAQLNITYLPVSDAPPDNSTVDWCLDHYDFARAQIILAKLTDHPSGPYIVSYSSPLSGTTSLESGRLLVEDLSRVPPDLAFLWVNAFTAQAGRAQYWDKPALRTLMLNLRTQVAVEAEAFDQVRTAYSNAQTLVASRIKIPE